jgi:quinol-cytochrome oxidoreductase complex cytochrome b subunit
METESSQPPSRDEAQQTLHQLDQDESAVRYPPLPQWFFLAMAALVAGLALAQLLEPSDSRWATLALGVVAVVLASRYWLNRDGVSWASARFVDMVPFLLGILGTFALSWLISETTGAWWIWIVGAVLAGGIVIRTGRTYRREFGQ